jgi:ABC-type tungstate transport system substrate-binding protein
MNIAVIVCVIGLVVYVVCNRRGPLEELAELGRLAFFAGLIAFLFGR